MSAQNVLRSSKGQALWTNIFKYVDQRSKKHMNAPNVRRHSQERASGKSNMHFTNQKLVENEGGFKCEMCEESFTCKTNLTRHKRNNIQWKRAL